MRNQTLVESTTLRSHSCVLVRLFYYYYLCFILIIHLIKHKAPHAQ